MAESDSAANKPLTTVATSDYFLVLESCWFDMD
jgi:hypothetical protein